MTRTQYKQIQFNSHYTALLAGAEIGLGSLIHSFRLPLGGHLLSLNQGVLLTFVTKKSETNALATKGVNTVSVLSALLKSLAPAGKKLTPMLALTFQGFLFSLGLLLGRNLLGIGLGMVLLSVWGFIQPVLIYYLFFGSSLFAGILKVWLDLSKSFGFSQEIGWWVLGGIVGLKVLIAVILGVMAWSASDAFEAKYVEKLKSPIKIEPKPASDAVRGAFKDLLNPIFLLSFVISMGFLYFSQSETAAQMLVYILRPLAVGFIFFWLARKLSERNMNFIISRYPSLGAAFETLKKRSRT